MATPDNKSGLLSKVAKFVRNPTTDWSDLDKPEPESVQESGYSKHALKEMIERKRQNDFVRRREFDQLRKLRRNGPSISPDVAGRPSFFQSSLPSSLDERATTLKKIDEIEAQMSKQWWKGKQDAVVQGGNFPVISTPAPQERVSDPASVSASTGESAFASTQSPVLDIDALASDDGESGPMSLSAAGAAPSDATQMMPLRSSVNKNRDSGITGFSISKLFSVELGDSLDDPDLEEAAIRFANGDDAGAEAGLLAALQADNVAPDSADGWAAALFDLYRATGQEASFDNLAIDYAQKFGRSAPAWFSTPEAIGHRPLASPAKQLAGSSSGAQFSWECPHRLDVQAVQDLHASLSDASGPLNLQWSQLTAIAPEAGKALAELFDQWCSQSVELHFRGADVLEKTLRALTPSDDKQVDPLWWGLRLDALRILRLQDEFELAALDYCVLYEVSPPPWADALCDFVDERVTSAVPLEATPPWSDDFAVDHGGDSDQALSTLPQSAEAMPAAVVELTGEVLGDAADALDRMQAGLAESDRLVISCARLIRVDFSAAGSILNWVAVRESQGCHVQFRDVPRLVAAFFNVIGINEHARVILRCS